MFIPVGDYEVGRISNVGKNRWAVDVGGAYTMANFKGGREFSSVLGFTFNGDNEDTDYSTGTEMHLETRGQAAPAQSLVNGAGRVLVRAADRRLEQP